MFAPKIRADGIHSSAFIARSPAKALNADEQSGIHMFIPGADHAYGPEEVGPFASRTFLYLIGLLGDPRPRFADGLDRNFDISKLVVAIDRVLVVNAAYQLETRSGDIGDNPFTIPNRVDIPGNGRGAEYEIWILFVATRKGGGKAGEDKRVSGQGADISNGEIGGAMKGEFEGEAWRRVGDGSTIEAPGRLLLFRG